MAPCGRRSAPCHMWPTEPPAEHREASRRVERQPTLRASGNQPCHVLGPQIKPTPTPPAVGLAERAPAAPRARRANARSSCLRGTGQKRRELRAAGAAEAPGQQRPPHGHFVCGPICARNGAALVTTSQREAAAARHRVLRIYGARRRRSPLPHQSFPSSALRGRRLCPLTELPLCPASCPPAKRARKAACLLPQVHPSVPLGRLPTAKLPTTCSVTSTGFAPCVECIASWKA